MSATTFVRMPTAKQMAMMGIPDLPIEAFGGLKPIPRAMGNAGMTLHKGGGGLAAVVGVVAAIAIPIAAPAIAGALATSMGVTAATFGLSATVGSVVGSAIVGAGLGAVTAAATGQNIGRGALMGGIGGGIGGYMTAPAEPYTGAGLKMPATSAPAPVATGTEGLTAPTTTGGLYPSTTWQAPDYSLTGGQSFSNVGLQAPGTAGATDLGTTLSGTQAGGTGISLTGNSGVGLNPNAAGGVGLQPPAGGVSGGVQLSQFPTASGTGQYASTTWTPPDYSLAGAQATSTGGTGIGLKMPTDAVAGVGGAGESVASASGYGLKVPTGSNVFGTGFGGASTQTAGAASGASAWDKFSDALKAKFTDPKQQADMVLRAAGQIAGSAIAGDGLSDEEKQLLAQQKQELETLRTTNQDLFNQRLQAAMELKGEAGYFDPNAFGMQSMKAYKTGVGRAERDVLRGIAPSRAGLRTAEQRRFALTSSAGGQTAYLQGYDTAEQNRIRTQQAAAGLIPTSGPTTALSYGNMVGNIYDAAERRRRQNAGDIGDLFGTFTGSSMANKA